MRHTANVVLLLGAIALYSGWWIPRVVIATLFVYIAFHNQPPKDRIL